MNSFRTLSWTPGADEHHGRGGWIEGEHGVTKPRQWYRYVSNMCSGSKVQKRRLYLMCGWPLSSHLRDGATSTLRAICGGRPRGESSPRRPQEPQDKSHAPGKEAPQGHKARFTFPRGGGGPQRVCTLGFRVLSSVDGQAYAGCLVLSSMSSMATAIRMGTMRCWGPRGPKTEPFPVSQEVLSLIEV